MDAIFMDGINLKLLKKRTLHNICSMTRTGLNSAFRFTIYTHRLAHEIHFEKKKIIDFILRWRLFFIPTNKI